MGGSSEPRRGTWLQGHMAGSTLEVVLLPRWRHLEALLAEVARNCQENRSRWRAEHHLERFSASQAAALNAHEKGPPPEGDGPASPDSREARGA